VCAGAVLGKNDDRGRSDLDACEKIILTLTTIIRLIPNSTVNIVGVFNIHRSALQGVWVRGADVDGMPQKDEAVDAFSCK
jgi:hypothetical protein